MPIKPRNSYNSQDKITRLMIKTRIRI